MAEGTHIIQTMLENKELPPPITYILTTNGSSDNYLISY